MKLLRYWGLVCWTAFKHSSSHTQNLLFALLAGLGVVAWLAPPVKTALAEAEIDVAGSEIAALAFGTIVALRLLMAPYWIYQEQATTIGRLNQRLRNKLNRKQIREQLGKFMDEGRSFLLTIQRDGVVPNPEMKEWDKRVKSWLTENFDSSYATTFVTARTHPEPPAPLASESCRINFIGVRFRLDNLGVILEELR